MMTAYLEEVEKMEKLEKEIDETDGEINRMVYELYGSTDEEIKIVEESLNK